MAPEIRGPFCCHESSHSALLCEPPPNQLASDRSKRSIGVQPEPALDPLRQTESGINPRHIFDRRADRAGWLEVGNAPYGRAHREIGKNGGAAVKGDCSDDERNSPAENRGRHGGSNMRSEQCIEGTLGASALVPPNLNGLRRTFAGPQVLARRSAAELEMD